MPSFRNPQQAAINTAATGQTTIVSNPSTSGCMYIWDFYCTISGATNIVFYDGLTALTGNMNFSATPNGIVFDQAGGMFPMWTIGPNSNLSWTSTAAVQRAGWIIYSN